MAWILVVSEKIGRGQTRFSERLLASATTQESRRNQTSGRATCFMGRSRQKGYAEPEQEPGHACGPCVSAVSVDQGQNYLGVTG
ncbi:hypothetical protein N005_20455 [Pseudomonas mediterranea CFBP 5447]|nr:hypothetical protein N005_20455 [Pseudomonas mediterranea CFBP 5447]